MTQQLLETEVNLGDYYTPHAAQLPIHQSTAQNKWMEMARRLGKSRGAFGEFLDAYMEAMNTSVDSSFVPPFHAWVAVPSYPQSNQVWNELMALLPPAFIYQTHQDDRLIYLKGSQHRSWGLLEVKSCHNPDALQTAGLDFLWVTEAQDVSNRAFEKLLPTLRSPGRMHRFVAEGIPALFIDHWFKKGCLAAQNGRPNHAYFHGTVYDNPTLTAEEITEVEGDKELLPLRVWERMYLAQFSEDAGYFRNVNQCIAGDLLPGPLPGTEYVAGLDLGRKVDASVLFIMDAKERRVVHHQRWDDAESWVLQREGVVRLTKEWGISQIIVDATGLGDVFLDELIGAGVPAEGFIFTQSTRENLLQDLAVALERQSISFPRVESLVRELQSMQVTKTQNNRLRVDAPPGGHDDAVMALALGLTACQPASRLDTGPRLVSAGGRYVPTQAEMEAGIVPRGMQTSAQRMSRERILSKIRDRQEEMGVS